MFNFNIFFEFVLDFKVILCDSCNRVVLYDAFVLGAGRPKRRLREINGPGNVFFFTCTHVANFWYIQLFSNAHNREFNDVYIYIYSFQTFTTARQRVPVDLHETILTGVVFTVYGPFWRLWISIRIPFFASNSTNRFCCQKCIYVPMFLHAYGTWSGLYETETEQLPNTGIKAWLCART